MSNQAAFALAALCLILWQEGILVHAPIHRRKRTTNNIILPWKSKLPLTPKRPDAWRTRLVRQFPAVAKEVEALLEAASKKPVSRSPRRITRDQRDTKRPNRRT